MTPHVLIHVVQHFVVESGAAIQPLTAEEWTTRLSVPVLQVQRVSQEQAECAGLSGTKDPVG